MRIDILAIEFYLKARSATPDDARPHSCLSAAWFEVGRYHLCVEATYKAIALSKDDESRKQRLFLRLAKAHLILRQWSAARSALKKLPSCEETRAIAQAVDDLDGFLDVNQNEFEYRRTLLLCLPRTMPIMLAHSPYGGLPCHPDNS